MLGEIPVDVPEGSELIAVATFLRDGQGEITMRMANVSGASSPLAPEQQARALRMLATGVEAEAIAQRSSLPDGVDPLKHPNSTQRNSR